MGCTARIGVAPLRLRDAGGGQVVTSKPRYLEAIRDAGAVPVVLGLIDAGLARGFVTGVDALVLPGGRDIPPGWYGRKPEPELEEVLEDDLAELYLTLAREALKQARPALGICLGLQVMNVALGGTLIQHLRPAAGQPLHRGAGHTDVRHPVELEPGSRLQRSLGAERIEVLSHHHQAAGELGRDLLVSARSEDGLAEGLEHREHPFYLGVQWHPERQPAEESSTRLFRALVSAAGRAA